MIKVAPEKVRAARVAAGYRFVQAAARAAKVNYKTVLNYEGAGEDGTGPPAQPKLSTLYALARAYGCTPREFAADPAEWDALLHSLGLTPAPLPSTDLAPALVLAGGSV